MKYKTNSFSESLYVIISVSLFILLKQLFKILTSFIPLYNNFQNNLLGIYKRELLFFYSKRTTQYKSSTSQKLQLHCSRRWLVGKSCCCRCGLLGLICIMVCEYCQRWEQGSPVTPQINYIGCQNALHQRYLNRPRTPHRNKSTVTVV